MSEPIPPLLSREAKVGMFALITVVILFWGTFYLGKLEGWLVPGHEYIVDVDTAHEMGVGTPVEVAGKRVGQILEVQLIAGGQRARLKLMVDRSVVLYENAVAQVQTVGFLGERYINLKPGSNEYPVLAPGSMIRNSSVPMTIDDFMALIQPTLENLNGITQHLNDILADERRVPAMLDALRRVAERLDEMVLRYEQTIGDLIVATADTAQLLRDRMPEMMDGVTRTIDRVNRVGDSIETTVADIREIITGIERGEGTVGALLKDESTATEVKQVVSALNDTLGRINRLQTVVEYLGMYHSQDREGNDGFNNNFSLRLQPAVDRYYSVGVVIREEDDTDTRTRTLETLDDAGNVVTTVTTRERIARDKLLLNLMFAKRFHDVTFRAGVIESTAGLGIDYAFWRDRIWLRAESFDFAREDDRPRLRSWGELRLFNHLRLAVGVEDALSRSGPQASFGAGVYFTDQDLKVLFGAASGAAF